MAYEFDPDEHDKTILRNLSFAVEEGIERFSRRQLSPHEREAAAQQYIALRGQQEANKTQRQVAQVHADGQRDVAQTNVEIRKAEAEANERIEAARLDLAREKAKIEAVLEVERLQIEKARVWVDAVKAIASAPPEIAQQLLAQITDVGHQLTGPPSPEVARLLTVRSDEPT